MNTKEDSSFESIPRTPERSDIASTYRYRKSGLLIFVFVYDGQIEEFAIAADTPEWRIDAMLDDWIFSRKMKAMADNLLSLCAHLDKSISIIKNLF